MSTNKELKKLKKRLAHVESELAAYEKVINQKTQSTDADLTKYNNLLRAKKTLQAEIGV
jgi:hypothetical protein